MNSDLVVTRWNIFVDLFVGGCFIGIAGLVVLFAKNLIRDLEEDELLADEDDEFY